MSIHKDIQYKKDNNETWSDWNNRFDNNEHKRDYIYDTIYTYCKSTLKPLALGHSSFGQRGFASLNLEEGTINPPLEVKECSSIPVPPKEVKECKPKGLDLPLTDIKIALEITDIIININIKDLIILLDNTELLNEKIKEVYKIVCDAEKSNH